jgi:hypothetical protein
VSAMSERMRKVSARFRTSARIGAGVLLFCFLCSAAQVQRDQQPAQTTVRGCLRTVNEHAFILIGDDRLGYMLSGDRQVFSNHADEKVEITGTSTARMPPRGGRAGAVQSHLLWLQPVKKDKKKKDSETVSVPGLPTIAVTAITPLAEGCGGSAKTR